MNKLPKPLIYLALIALIVGILVKLFGVDFTSMGVMQQYPVKPLSFLNFANTILLLSIAISVLRWKE